MVKQVKNVDWLGQSTIFEHDQFFHHMGHRSERSKEHQDCHSDQNWVRNFVENSQFCPLCLSCRFLCPQSNPLHPVSFACFLDRGYARQCSGFTSWIRQMYLSCLGSFLSQGHLFTSSWVTGEIQISYMKWFPSWIGSTHSKISSLPAFCHISMSSSVAQFEKASYRFLQQLPHWMHLKDLGGMSVTLLNGFGSALHPIPCR